MKRLAVILALIVIFARSARMQEHAPVASQCQADRAVWGTDLDADSNLKALAVAEVHKRMWEMANCQNVDAPNSAGYIKVATILLMVEDVRYQHFLQRHNLMSQFVQEDAEGKR